MEFSLYIFSEFAEFSHKKKIIKEYCRVGTQDLMCKLYHSATEPQAKEQILHLEKTPLNVINVNFSMVHKVYYCSAGKRFV